MSGSLSTDGVRTYTIRPMFRETVFLGLLVFRCLRLLFQRAGTPSIAAPPMKTKAIVAGSGTALMQLVISLVSSVTAPLIAKALPSSIDAPVSMVILVRARICPSKSVPVPSVAELPTCQNTLHPGIDPPLMVTTDAALAVVRVLPIWKTNKSIGITQVIQSERSSELSRGRKEIDAGSNVRPPRF